MALLKIDGLSAGYGGRPVLKEVTFSVQAGGFLGVIGPNGSGKSTLIKAMTRFLPVSAGCIALNGRDLHALSLSDLSRQVAVVNQHTPTDLQLSVREYVLLGRLPYRNRWHLWENSQDGAIVDNAMALAGVGALAARRFSELSGGERQSVVIARALAQEPRVLFLDEPTTHLDIRHQVALLDLLRRLNREQGLTLVAVLHDLNLAAEYCDRLLLLHEGGIHSQGAPGEVLTYETLETVYKTIVLVGASPVSGKPVVYPVPEESRKG